MTNFENVPFNWSISSSYAFSGFLYFKQLKYFKVAMLYYAATEVMYLNVFQKSVLTFSANIPLSILINKGQLKITVKPERQIFLLLKDTDIY